MRPFALMGALAVLVPTAVAQGPGSGTARITGVVLADEGQGAPIGGAIVTVTGAGLSRPRSAITDVNGGFGLERLPTGRFTLTASKAPYLAMTYGARRPGRPGTPLSLAAGQTISDLVMRLPRGAVMTGTLHDDNGLPVSGVTVSAIRRTMPGVSEMSANIVTATTDDRGEYRIFGLLPGQYFLAANQTTSSGAVAIPSAEEIDRKFGALQQRLARPGGQATKEAMATAPPTPTYGLAVVFYPGTAVSAEAGALTVGNGEERRADFVVRPVRSGAIEGSVRTIDGSPLPLVSLSLDQKGPPLPASFRSQPTLTVRPTTADGRFKMSGVAPGQYLLSARSMAGKTASGVLMPMAWAFSDVTFAGADLNAVTLTLQRGLRFTGKVVLDADGPERAAVLASVRVSLHATGWEVSNPGGPNLRFTQPATTAVRPDGSFDIGDLLPAKYLVSATVSGSAWLRSAMVDGIDALDVPIELKDADVPGAVLTLSDRKTELSGFLKTSSNAPATDYVIVVFTTDRMLWRPGARRVKFSRPATDGRFVVAELPGGEYFLAALTDIDPADLGDPSFLAELVPSALKIKIGEGENKVQDVIIKTSFTSR